MQASAHGGGGAPFNHAAILTACGFPIRFLSDAEVRAGRLAEVDVFVTEAGKAVVIGESQKELVLLG